MNISIRNNSEKPIYEQIADAIKTSIINQELQAGEILPSIRSLAKDLRISVITTKRAYEELEQQGFIETIPGKGSYVAIQNTEFIKEEHRRQIEKLLTEMVHLAKHADISQEELQTLLNLFYEEDTYE